MLLALSSSRAAKHRAMSTLLISAPFLLPLPPGGSRLVFVIGGAEGLPSALKEKKELWSLSKLTFTHQWARVLLTEQIYRATEIKKGSGYHKE